MLCHALAMAVVESRALDEGSNDKLDSALSLLNEIQYCAHTGGGQSHQVVDKSAGEAAESLEDAAKKVHEEWRRKKHSEILALGAKLPVPQWKRIPDDQYKEWSAVLSEDVLAEVHRYCPPQPTNPSAPHLNMCGGGMKVHLTSCLGRTKIAHRCLLL